KKPTRKEFESVAKISAIGILILGALGFLISIIMKSFI
ncbi:MAG TPA: protein translocase SEC61 complex subunit gamma, partial [Candidatus Pacearchaeota archaeon]|nr:protein translocase SEC61 complex subunit gamma [Candidatus Pacearchaeota archaeon]